MSKKQEILATALALFVENGFENTSTAQISQQAGVATGTLFHHFNNKQAILNTLYVECKQSLYTALNNNSINSIDLKNRLQDFWQNYVHWATDNPNKFKFLQDFSEHPLILPESRAAADNAYHGLITLLKDAKETNRLAKLPLDYILMLTKAHFTIAAHYCLENPKALGKKKLPRRLYNAYWKAVCA